MEKKIQWPDMHFQPINLLVMPPYQGSQEDKKPVPSRHVAARVDLGQAIRLMLRQRQA